MNDERIDELTPLEKETLRAMRLRGELAPESAAEVESAEANWDAVSEEDLPESLKNVVALAAQIVEKDEQRCSVMKIKEKCMKIIDKYKELIGGIVMWVSTILYMLF